MSGAHDPIDSAMFSTLGAVREAFILEHEFCGELDSAVQDNRVWMTCTCGAAIVRTPEPATR
jgi:hypothetical protein